MADKITFSKIDESIFAYDYVSQGVTLFQIDGEPNATFSILAGFPDAPYALVSIYKNPLDDVAVFMIDIPSGMKVRIKSSKQVADAWKENIIE